MQTGEIHPPVKETDRPPTQILVVEDNIEMRQICRHVLVRAGYVVITAANGEGGWTALQAESYDLLITDNNLPGLSGVDLITNLREAKITVPIILSAATVPPDSEKLGLAAVLIKPYSVDDLEKTVRAVLEQNSSTPRQRELAPS